MQNFKHSTKDETMIPLPEFDHVQTLLDFNVIQVDKSQSDYSTLEKKLKIGRASCRERVFRDV